MVTVEDGGERADIPMVELDAVPFLHLNGIGVLPSPYVYRLVGWITLPDSGIAPSERRIVARLGLPLDVTRKLMDDLKRGFRRNGK